MSTVSHSIILTNDSTTVDDSPDSMAQQVNLLARAPLRDLPAEIYVVIMERIPDLASLHNFIIAFPRMALIFKNFQKQIFIGVLRSSGLSLQLQKIITAIMVLREKHPETPCPPKAFFNRYLDQKDQPVDMMKFDDPVDLLRDIARIAESIEEYVESFARRRILVHNVKSIPVSSTESYRVRRAFWRFQLCYELSHPGGSVDVKHNDEAPKRETRRYVEIEGVVLRPLAMRNWLVSRGKPQAPLLRDFLQTLSFWEIEEMNVARFHLTTQVNAFQRKRIAGTPNDLRNQNSLLQRLVMDLDNWHADPENPRDHLLVTSLRVFQGNPALRHDPFWPGNPLEVAFKNVDPNTLNGLNYEKAQWGWCMWDIHRLGACGFQGFDIFTEAWSGKTPPSDFRCINDIVAAQFSAIDNELSLLFRRQSYKELQAYEHGEHMRRSQWLMNWVRTIDPDLYRGWRDICETKPFTAYQAQTCYLRALTLKRWADRSRRARWRVYAESRLGRFGLPWYLISLAEQVLACNGRSDRVCSYREAETVVWISLSLLTTSPTLQTRWMIGFTTSSAVERWLHWMTPISCSSPYLIQCRRGLLMGKAESLRHQPGTRTRQQQWIWASK